MTITATELVPTRGPAPLSPLAVNPLGELTGRWLVQFTNENTRAAYARDLHHFLTWADNREVNPLHLGREHLNVYALELSHEFTPSTVARRLTAVGSWYEYAIDLELVTTNPTARVKRPKSGPDHVKLTPALSESEIVALIAAGTSIQDRALVLLLASTGMRISQALQLTTESITTERGHHIINTLGKGGKYHRAPLGPMVFDALTELGRTRGHGLLFLGARGKPLTRHGAARTLTRLGNRAGLGKAITPHQLRAGAITNSLLAGVPLHVVQEMAGHSDPKTTGRYNRAAVNLDTHPSYTLTANLARAMSQDTP
jgi:integrase/recombinase XerD